MKLFFWRKNYPQDAVRELLELTIKAGRRCAYDLDHAATSIPDPEWRAIFSERSRHWLLVFAPIDGPKDYRTRLHNENMKLWREIERLQGLCRDHDIDPDDPAGEFLS